MADCFITRTGAYLPGAPITNDCIQAYMGQVPGEERVRRMILRANGIKTRHYALDKQGNQTDSIYQMASCAVNDCLTPGEDPASIDYLAAGTSLAPIIAPGVSSILHEQLSKDGVVGHSVEITSNSGLCSSGAQPIVNAARAVKAGDARKALAVGIDQPSNHLKAERFAPAGPMPEDKKDMPTSPWFMSVFLRFMLSDGAGAFLIEPEPNPDTLSFKIDWTYSRSFANEAPLCMHMTSKNMILTQDVRILREYIGPLSKRALQGAMERHGETLEAYTMVLPHMSSYFFEADVKQGLEELSQSGTVPYWSNLATAGNAGAASIYIMLDEYTKTHEVHRGDRFLLYVPESGQFNFVYVSLTVV